MRHGIGWLAGAMVAALAGAGAADEERERQLEQRVEELDRKLADVQRRVDASGDEGGGELAERVAELEKLARKDQDGMFGFWKGGTKWADADKDFAFQVYGRIQNDWIWWDSDEEVEEELGEELNTGTEFRRVRLGATGKLYRNVKFKPEFDFAGGEVEFADVYVELAGVFCDFADFKVGHFKEPFGLDELTASRFVTFLERDTISQGGSAPARNTGVQLSGDALDERLAWQFGMFRDAGGAGNDIENEQEGEYNWTGRVAGRPYVSEDGREYLHLGAAASLRRFGDEEARFRARPEVPMSPRFVDTGTFDARSATFLGLEAAFVSGPFAAQAEYATADVDALGASDPRFDAFSIQGSWFLTGGTKGYKPGEAAFDRPKLKNICGKIERFSIDTLVEMLGRAGIEVRFTSERRVA